MADHHLPTDGLNTDRIQSDRSQTERMIRVTVDTATAELVSDRFWQLGVRAVSEIDLAHDMVEVSSSVGNSADAIERATATFDPDWAWRVDDVAAEASNEWRRFAQPVRYRPDMLMVPAWIDAAEHAEATDTVTLVEPGSAFGLGDHPTTRNSMALLADRLRDDDAPATSMLDVGCGTGVLAVLAAQLGVPTVRAIDVANAAVDATMHNAVLNGVGGRIDVDTTPLADVDGTFDVVMANILAPVLVALAADLRRVLAPGGSLIISGILDHNHAHVLSALEPLVVTHRASDAGWLTARLSTP